MNTQEQILIVEDETDLGDLIAYNLHRDGYQTMIARDGQAALSFLAQALPDLIILDVMLPKVSGLDVARQVRTAPRTAAVPILMLTARADEVDHVAGLRLGADDYLTKPFSMKVLLAHVKALLRRTRSGPLADTSLRLGPLSADLSIHEASLAGEPMHLTLTEFRLIVAMMRSQGKVLSRVDLMYTAMGPGVLVTTRTIDVHMAALRKKLGRHGRMIRTVRGVGYRMSDRPDAQPVSESGG